jgi:hypothetical protein
MPGEEAMRYAIFYGILALGAALLLPACSPADPPEVKINITSDSWCKVAKKYDSCHKGKAVS